MVRLQVYISDDCWTCDEAKRVVAEILPWFPGMSVEWVDMEHGLPPPHVFAVPTYVLDGRVIFLGNPTREQLHQTLADAQPAGST